MVIIIFGTAIAVSLIFLAVLLLRARPPRGSALR